jgi:hypothetical protein
MAIGETADGAIRFKSHPRLQFLSGQLGVLINHFVTAKLVGGTVRNLIKGQTFGDLDSS